MTPSSLSRRALLERAATVSAATVAARGVYGVLDGVAAPQRARAAVAGRLQEQYLIQRLEVIQDNGVTVVIPPIHNDVFTARLRRGKRWTRAALRSAQTRLEGALSRIDQRYPATASGITIVVSWGLPYFRERVAGPWAAKGPRDLTLPLPGGGHDYAVLDAIRFPSDPGGVVLEDNDVAFKLRSDSPRILAAVEKGLFGNAGSRTYIGDLFDLTSKRIGFAGRGFGSTSVAKQLALEAGVPGAASIPDRAQLMLGFTSTQTAALGPDNIVSFETLPGLTDQWPDGYFAHGCAMHLSHLDLDLEAWYGRSYATRVGQMHSPRTAVPADEHTVTLPNGPDQVATLQQVKDDAQNLGRAGHNSALQTATRLGADVIDNYGRRRARGTGVPEREDFNTLDDPFFWYVDEHGAVHQPEANQPGLHFAVFVPTSSKFHGARKAMDGVLPDGTNLRAGPYNLTDEQIGFNSVMRATHRQNFLVPPRRHRSFPLVELL